MPRRPSAKKCVPLAEQEQAKKAYEAALKAQEAIAEEGTELKPGQTHRYQQGGPGQPPAVKRVRFSLS